MYQGAPLMREIYQSNDSWSYKKNSLMQSLYEIETTVLRSSRTQGLSWGVSEEVGKAIRVLEQSNLAGLESFKRIIDLGFDNLNKLLEVNQKKYK